MSYRWQSHGICIVLCPDLSVLTVHHECRSLRGLSDVRHVIWRYIEGCQRLRAQVLTATGPLMKQGSYFSIPNFAIDIEFDYTLATIESRISTEEGSNYDEFSRQVDAKIQRPRYPE